MHAFFVHCEKRDWQGIWTVQFCPKSAKTNSVKYFDPSFVYPIFIFDRNRAYYFVATNSPCYLFLFFSAVLRFMDRYDPNISLPESGNMRDIPKWRSQKAVWVPFFITIDMSVWTTLKAVLEADAAKQLHFQKNTDISSQEPSAKKQAPPKSADDTGTSI